MRQPNVWIGRTLAALAAAAVVVYFLNPFHTASADPFDRVLGFRLFRNPSLSMWPTLPRGKIFLANVAALRSRDPRIGEIVIFKFPPIPNVLYVKRVVAVGGSVVEGHDGALFVDGKRAEEKYLPAAVRTQVIGDFPAITVPPDCFFVMGDNRGNSADSRAWGALPRELVLGIYASLWGD